MKFFLQLLNHRQIHRQKRSVNRSFHSNQLSGGIFYQHQEASSIIRSADLAHNLRIDLMDYESIYTPLSPLEPIFNANNRSIDNTATHPMFLNMLSLIVIAFILSFLIYKTIFQPLPLCITNDTLSLTSFFYSNILPNRALSRLMRPLTQYTIPKSWRGFVYHLFGKIYPIAWSEFADDLTSYRTFHEFFTRRLIKKRVMNKADLVSPVDGTVVAFGTVDEAQTLEQIKGVRFNLKQFLYGYDAPDTNDTTKRLTSDIQEGNQLYYTIIYLAPGDYHRFHSPADGIKIACINHIVGDLYPVKPSWLRKLPGLFSLNERMVLSGTWKEDLFFAYIPVGAFNIGSIHLKDDPFHLTNQRQQDDEVWYRNNSGERNQCKDEFDEGEELMYDKGDEIGYFSFGSTVAVIFEAPNFDFHITREQKIKFGDAVGDIGLFI